MFKPFEERDHLLVRINNLVVVACLNGQRLSKKTVFIARINEATFDCVRKRGDFVVFELMLEV